MMRVSLLRWLLAIIWMGVIFLGSSSSNPYQALPAGWTGRCTQIIPWENLGQLICQNDTGGNLSHILEYAVLGFLFANAIDSSVGKAEQGRMKTPFLAFIATALFAFSDELHQVFIPERAFQILDLCLDATGAMLGVLLFWYIKSRKPIRTLS